MTNSTFKAAGDYLKQYEASNRTLEVEAGKDDFNKLILAMQNDV